jgi:hypothetical protein
MWQSKLRSDFALSVETTSRKPRSFFTFSVLAVPTKHVAGSHIAANVGDKSTPLTNFGVKFASDDDQVFRSDR